MQHPLDKYHESQRGRNTTPKLDIRGMSRAETKQHYKRAGERWSAEQDRKIWELRGPGRAMPWDEIAKLVDKTPLACRLRMHNLKKERKRQARLARAADPKLSAEPDEPPRHRKKKTRRARRSASPSRNTKIVPKHDEPRQPASTSSNERAPSPAPAAPLVSTYNGQHYPHAGYAVTHYYQPSVQPLTYQPPSSQIPLPPSPFQTLSEAQRFSDAQRFADAQRHAYDHYAHQLGARQLADFAQGDHHHRSMAMMEAMHALAIRPRAPAQVEEPARSESLVAPAGAGTGTGTASENTSGRRVSTIHGLLNPEDE